jgi:excinuclease ABC subunit A
VSAKPWNFRRAKILSAGFSLCSRSAGISSIGADLHNNRQSSRGELQRIKLAYHLVHKKKPNLLYLFDEPTIGLHADDIKTLLQCFQKLVEEGNSLVVIEHNLDIIKSADYIIDLGPEGGEEGGYIVAQGRPEDIAAAPGSITGVFLQKALAGSQPAGTGRR